VLISLGVYKKFKYKYEKSRRKIYIYRLYLVAMQVNIVTILNVYKRDLDLTFDILTTSNS
jgi:hypothetical protein